MAKLNSAFWAWALVWLLFAAFTLSVGLYAPQGMTAYFSQLSMVSWGGQVMMDLVMMAVVALFFIVPDARKRGVGKPVCVALVIGTAFLGSLVPLAYMAWRATKHVPAS